MLVSASFHVSYGETFSSCFFGPGHVEHVEVEKTHHNPFIVAIQFRFQVASLSRLWLHQQSSMPVIRLSTSIAAPPERVFDLARSIDAHQQSAAGTSERAVAGVTTGLIGMGDEVTWEARHFGVKQKLTVRVTAFERPFRFQDIMVSGAFKSMKHDHAFSAQPPGTLMIDSFEFESPFGIFGQIVDRMVLYGYMRRFLVQRNQVLKNLAESDEWRKYLVA